MPEQVVVPVASQKQLKFAEHVVEVVSFVHGFVAMPVQSEFVESQVQPAAVHVVLSKLSSQNGVISSTHVPGAEPEVQPGTSEQHELPLHRPQLVYKGVPMHVGPVVKTTPLVCGKRTIADLQHKRASGSEQSLLDLHCFSQVCWHTPSQQRAPAALPMQSEDCVHAVGHGE